MSDPTIDPTTIWDDLAATPPVNTAAFLLWVKKSRPIDQKVVSMRCEGASYKRIADELGRSMEGVRGQYFRAVRRFRDHLIAEMRQAEKIAALQAANASPQDIGEAWKSFGADDLTLSTRANNCLRNLRLTLGEFDAISDDDILGLPKYSNMGIKTIREIRGVISKFTGKPVPTPDRTKKAKIGDRFRIEGNPDNLWQVTDIGTRTIIAIPVPTDDPSWMNGPPYALAEVVFDEEDIPSIIWETRAPPAF